MHGREMLCDRLDCKLPTFKGWWGNAGQDSSALGKILQWTPSEERNQHFMELRKKVGKLL